MSAAGEECKPRALSDLKSSNIPLAVLLTPPVPNLSRNYDGLEFRWKFLTFRPARSQSAELNNSSPVFKNEIYFLAAVLFYVAVYFIGKKKNEKKVNKWSVHCPAWTSFLALGKGPDVNHVSRFEQHLPVLESQFSKPTQAGGYAYHAPPDSHLMILLIITDGNTDFFIFSTGRRAVISLHTTFSLRPRHDLFQYAFQFLRGLIDLDYKVYDEVELDFTFREHAGRDGAVPECVWAIVAKNEMKTIKDRRWDLTFTKTSENSALPPSLTVMSEFADVTENLLKQHGSFSLSTVLSSPDILPYFRSISLTDQPRTRPYAPLAPSERTKHLIISLALPPAGDATLTLPLITAAFQLVDVIAGEGKLPGVRGGLAASLRPETKMKLKKAREVVEKEIKEEIGREKREEAAEEKAAAKKKTQEERISKLSAAEQKKILDREKKRALRKTSGKVKVR
ncbi:hypothetical protein A0H81_10046, partial [Grifola frondosa]